MAAFPWGFTQPPKPTTPRELMLQRLAEGVPPELAAQAAGIDWDTIKDDAEVTKALAEGEIVLFERARDSGATGTVRAAMRRETRTWVPKADVDTGRAVEDYLRD